MCQTEQNSPEEKEVCDALVHRLHRELGHSDIRGMVDSLRQNRAHPTVLAAAKSSCDQWKGHGTWSSPADGQFLLETPLEGGASVIRIWRTAPRQELLGNVSASEARQMLQESWFKFYGRPETVMTDPEGCFRERLFREWLASKNVKWDPQPAEAAWRMGILDKVLDVLKNAATRAARRAPEVRRLHRVDPHPDCHWMDKQLGEVSASLASDGRHRLHIQRECYRAYLDEEMSLQQKRREMHKSRPFRVWSSGEWCWFWCSRAHLHRRTKASRQFKEGAFLGAARVLLQERERKGDDLKYKAVVWVVDGHQLVRCSSTHLRPVSTAEQTLCSLRDGEALTFQQVVQELPKRNFVDLVGQPSPVEEDFEEPMNVASGDDELHENFLSGEEFASAPDNSEVPKGPQMTYQTRSASSQAETPAAMSPEPTEAPFIPKVEQSSSTARPSVTQPPTVPQSSTSQPSTIPPTASPSHMELSPEPMSQFRAMKRLLEQTLQPESKRMSLGEDPSVEHGILAAEDLRWLPKQRSREVRHPQTCWNPDATEKRGPVLTSCAQDEVVDVAFALSHHEAIKIAETPATALAALARQGRGEVRASTLTPQQREELVKAKQKEISSFLKHAAVEAAPRSGLQCKSLMRMRWVITRKSDDSLKARLVIQGFTDPQLGAKPTASPTVSRRGRQLFLTVAGSLRMKVFEGDAKNCLLARISWRSGTALRTDRRTGESTRTGTSSVCEIAKIGVRFDRRSERLVGTCGDRHDQIEMANADH